MLKRLANPSDRRRIARGFVTEPPYLPAIGWHRVRPGVQDPAVNGKLVSEVAAGTDGSALPAVQGSAPTPRAKEDCDWSGGPTSG